MKRIGFIIPLLMMACTARNQPADSRHKVNQINDIQYYGAAEANEKHHLNLFIPEGIENPPLLIWIHGGAWAFGDRSGETPLGIALAKEGIATAIISYRLSPATWVDPPKEDGIQHPEHIRDVARAFNYLFTYADKYGIDRNNIFVSGYSAGGHLSALISLDERFLQETKHKVTDIRGAIPIAGAYDIQSYYEGFATSRGKPFADAHVKGVFGETEEQLREASVTTWIEHSQIPMLVISEAQTYNYTRLLENRVDNLGIENITFWHIRDEDHKSLLSDLKSPDSKYRERIVKFIKDNMA